MHAVGQLVGLWRLSGCRPADLAWPRTSRLVMALARPDRLTRDARRLDAQHGL